MMSLARLLGLDTRGRGVALDRYLPVRQGLRGATTASPLDPFTRDILRTFDRDDARQDRYSRMWSYYQNGQYSEQAKKDRAQELLHARGVDATGHLVDLYKFIRAFYNPATQAVDVDTNAIFREPTTFAATGGSQMNDALDVIVRNSRLDERRANIVRYGAATGDVYLLVDPDYQARRVKIQVYSPELVRVVRNPHDKDEIDYAVISYDYTDYSGPEIVVYNRTDILYPDRTLTFRDGKLFAFDGVSPERPNRLGVVPIEHIKNLDTDLEYGLSTFWHILPTIDVVNEILSFLLNIIKINGDPTLIAKGMKSSELVKGDPSDPLKSNMWFIPVPRVEGGFEPDVTMLEWKGNLPDVMNVLEKTKDDVRDAVPELHVGKMQQQGAYSGFALNAMMFPFVSKISQMRPTYAGGVKRALSMGLCAMDIMAGRTRVFDPLNARYRVDVTLPTVLPVDEDALVNRVVAKLEAGLIGEEDALKELGYPQDEIAGLLERAQKRADRNAQRETNSQVAVVKARPTAQQIAQRGTNGQPVNRQLNSNGQK